MAQESSVEATDVENGTGRCMPQGSRTGNSPIRPVLGNLRPVVKFGQLIKFVQPLFRQTRPPKRDPARIASVQESPVDRLVELTSAELVSHRDRADDSRGLRAAGDAPYIGRVMVRHGNDW